MTTDKLTIFTDNGDKVSASAPVIVSASRSTDIPAFYSHWFFERLKKGYVIWTNPFNGKNSYISFNKTRFIVFWSKNPQPLLNYLDVLKEKGIGCYIQYTLNDYEEERLEKGVPPLENRIETFKALVRKLGYGQVVWRFDPMILTEDITIEKLISKVKNIGEKLKGFTEKLVFSFADIASYRKVKSNLEKNGVKYIEWTENLMREFTKRLSKMNEELGWNYHLATCAEGINLEEFGIEHNHCIDEILIIKSAWKDNDLMEFLKVGITESQPSLFGEQIIPEGAIALGDNRYAVRKTDNKDKGQRLYCGCIKSKDIGKYNTCPHLCEYCYANSTKELAISNWRKHLNNPHSDQIY